MTHDELLDLLFELEGSLGPDDKPHRFEEAAAGVSVGEYGRASLLVAAGEHWQMRGEYDEARRCFDAALADGGESACDPVANLFSLALDSGDEPAAAGHLARLRDLVRSDQGTVTTCLRVGETLEIHGRPREAHRWFTMPLTWVDDEDDLDYFCLVARRRVRNELGLAPDRLDQLAASELEARRG